MPTLAALTLNTYITPGRPFVGAPAQAPGDDPTWSPTTSTLIAGETDAILIDTLLTFDQVDALSKWIETTGKNLTGIYITHGHSDHWIGLARLLERFPEARGFATAPVLERARFEATDPGMKAYWASIFPGEIPESPVVPDLLDTDVIELEGHRIEVMDIGQGDTEHSSVYWVPSISAAVGGDVIYNGVHMMTAETDPVSREAWISSLDTIAALHPQIVVAGHQRVGASNTPDALAASQQYLRDFSRLVAENDTVDAIVTEMLALHGDRENRRTLWHSARIALAKRLA